MARVRFTKDFDFKPTPQSTIGYLAGTELTVKQECADLAIKAGAAVAVDKARKDSDDGEKA